MTKEEAYNRIDAIIAKHEIDDEYVTITNFMDYDALRMARKALEVEPLTDIEQRIFLAAMSREEKVCKEVCADGEGVDLVAVCHRIEKKVKTALWK